MKRAIALCACLTVCAVLTACTSSGGEENKASPKLAALYNAQLAIAYMNQGRMDLARIKLSEARKQAPHMPEVLNALALYYTRLARYDEAEKQYRLSLQYDPDNPNTLNNYGAFLCAHGQPKASLEYFTRAASQLDYDTPDSALANAGLCALEIPDKKLATHYFKRTLAINPNQSQALWQLGLLTFEAGHYSDANRYLARLIATTSDPSPRVLWVAIEAAWTVGRRDTAERYGRKLLERYPDSAEARKFIELLSGSP